MQANGIGNVSLIERKFFMAYRDHSLRTPTFRCLKENANEVIVRDLENDCGRFVLVVLSDTNGFKEAKRKAVCSQWRGRDCIDLKYARIFSYFLSNFKVALEVKIKARQNKKGILECTEIPMPIKEKNTA